MSMKKREEFEDWPEVPAWSEEYARWYELLEAAHPYRDVAIWLRELAVKRLGPGKPVNILEWGCGTGILSNHLVAWNHAGSKIVAVDPSEAMVEMGRSQYGANVDFHVRSGFRCELGVFDQVVAHFNVVNYIDPCEPDFRNLFVAAQAWLKDDGMFVFDALDAEDCMREGLRPYKRRTQLSGYVADSYLKPEWTDERTSGRVRLLYGHHISARGEEKAKFRTRHDIYLHRLMDIMHELKEAGFGYVRVYRPTWAGYAFVATKKP